MSDSDPIIRDAFAIEDDHGFDVLLGLQIDRPDPQSSDLIHGRVPVAPYLLNGLGILHPGVMAAVAEALASRGTAAVMLPRGCAVMGSGNNTSVVADLRDGTLHASAQPLHRADDTWLWSVTMTDDRSALVAISQVTIAIRPMRRA